MAGETTPAPTTPAANAPAASAAPAATTPAPKETLAAAADRVFSGEAAKTPAPTAAAAAKRLLKLKLLDDKEEDFDLDDAYADETKRAALVADIQRGRAYEHARTRARVEGVELTKKQWNDWLASHGYDVVQDAAHPSGWILRQRQVTKPAGQDTKPADPELDPLAAEEASLKTAFDEGSAAAVARVAEIRAERRMILRERERAEKAKTEADKAAAERAKAERETVAKTAYEKAKAELTTEVGKFIEARTKDFEGPDVERVKSRTVAAAVSAGEAAARSGKNWPDVLAAAKAAVFQEADDRAAYAAHARGNLPTPKPKYQAAPIVGAAPAGGNTTNDKKKTLDEAADEIFGVAR